MCASLETTCTGWVARYEVWNINGEPVRVGDVSINLVSKEIWLQVRESLRQEILNTWKMQFPLSIRADLRAFSVLRTIFLTESLCHKSSITLRQIELPLNHDDRLRTAWSNDRKGFEPVQPRNDVPATLQLVKHDVYAYDIILSPNGRYACFLDYDFWTSFFSVFEVEKIPGAGARLVSTCKANLCILNGQYGKPSFHPSEPLLCGPTLQGIFIWDCLNGEQVLVSNQASANQSLRGHTQNGFQRVSRSQGGNQNT